LKLRGQVFAETSDEAFAQSFGNLAPRFPERFAALLLQVPASSGTAYLRAYLYGVAELPPPAPGAPPAAEAASVATLEQILQHFAAHLHHPEVARAVCRLVEKRARDGWSDETIRLVQGWAEPGPLDSPHDGATPGAGDRVAGVGPQAGRLAD
jgi:hypothetical protein